MIDKLQQIATAQLELRSRLGRSNIYSSSLYVQPYSRGNLYGARKSDIQNDALISSVEFLNRADLSHTYYSYDPWLEMPTIVWDLKDWDRHRIEARASFDNRQN